MQKLPNNSVVVIDNASFHKRHHLKTMTEKDRHITRVFTFLFF
ncbi:Uncharacterised protein [Orientia tsutsugamushi]|nr:Uncharacterised protein [Orientia tsutsugamushi]